MEKTGSIFSQGGLAVIITTLILLILVPVAVFAYRGTKKKNKKSEEQPIPPTANPLEKKTKDKSTLY